MIDKTILKDCKKRHTNLSMAWIDYRKAYALVPHSWVNECMEKFRIAEKLRMLLQNSMQKWGLSLTGNGEKEDIPGRQSIAIVVCVKYGAIVFDS